MALKSNGWGSGGIWISWLSVLTSHLYGKQVYKYWTRKIIALERSNGRKSLPMSRAHRRAPRGVSSR